MPVSFNHTQCVSRCLLVCIQDGSMSVRASSSHNAKTNRVLSRVWSCHVLNDFVQTVKLRVMLWVVDEEKLIFSLWTEFAVIVTLFGKFWDVLITLYFSRSTTFSEWCWYWEGTKEKGARWDAYRLHTTKGIPNCWDVGVCVVVSLQNWWFS